MKRKTNHMLLLAVIALAVTGTPGMAQNGGKYELLPAPDLWYNDVDGIRVGMRVQGQVPGTFEDGPHRLDAGAWFATWIPELPVSYYVSFTEPIYPWSDFGSEANIRVYSKVRTGFSKHGLQFNKRWQQGFDEDSYVKISAGFGLQKRFDSEYVPYPGLWQEELLWLSNLQFALRNQNGLGPYFLGAGIAANLFGEADRFLSSTAEYQQLAGLGSNFELRTRLFAGISSDETVPEYLYTHSFNAAVHWMDNGLTRAKGTIPVSWLDSGLFQVAGGANLRGYLEQDIDALTRGLVPLFTSMGAVNVEIDYPNPLDRAIKKIPVIGGVVRFRSYIFFDSGTSFGITDIEETRTLADAGAGFIFSLNIPDYLGNPRGISLRYDIPLWLSHPGDGQHVGYRSVIGIGTIISL